MKPTFSINYIIQISHFLGVYVAARGKTLPFQVFNFKTIHNFRLRDNNQNHEVPHLVAEMPLNKKRGCILLKW